MKKVPATPSQTFTATCEIPCGRVYHSINGMTPQEFANLHGIEVHIGEEIFKPVRRARLKASLHGYWSTWRKGLRVLAQKNDDGSYFIERVRRRGALDCINKFANAPARCIRFE